MPDTQKTTKAVREAPTASQNPRGDASTVAAGLAHSQGKKLPGSWSGEVVSASPRYTVELTTEGWQIKDNVRDVILAGVFAAQSQAEMEIETLEVVDAAEEQGRR